MATARARRHTWVVWRTRTACPLAATRHTAVTVTKGCHFSSSRSLPVPCMHRNGRTLTARHHVRSTKAEVPPVGVCDLPSNQHNLAANTCRHTRSPPPTLRTQLLRVGRSASLYTLLRLASLVWSGIGEVPVARSRHHGTAKLHGTSSSAPHALRGGPRTRAPRHRNNGSGNPPTLTDGPPFSSSNGKTQVR